MKVNVWMSDGSELKEVNLFRNKELGDSIVSTKAEIEELLNFENNRTVFFSGMYVQGGLIPRKIIEYEIIDDTEDVSSQLLRFVKSNQDIYDINVPDVVDFIVQNRDGILKILRQFEIKGDEIVYCNIVKTTIPYDLSLNYLRHIQLLEDAKQGDVIDSCIISSSGNLSNYFKKGHIAGVIPIPLVDIIESNRDDLKLSEFKKVNISNDIWRYIRQ